MRFGRAQRRRSCRQSDSALQPTGRNAELCITPWNARPKPEASAAYWSPLPDPEPTQEWHRSISDTGWRPSRHQSRRFRGRGAAAPWVARNLAFVRAAFRSHISFPRSVLLCPGSAACRKTAIIPTVTHGDQNLSLRRRRQSRISNVTRWPLALRLRADPSKAHVFAHSVWRWREH